MDGDQLELRVRSLERKILCLTALSGLLLTALAVSTAGRFTGRVKAAEDTKVLRVKGLVIEDEQGRGRILLGAPFPAVQERLRKDVTGTDLVFLDEEGHDRFRVGETLPASPGFHRIGASYGVTILDTKGSERGGMGFLSNGSTVNRAVIALDRPENPSVSSDAWGAIVDDASGFAGTVYLYPPAGDHDQEGIMIGTKGNKASITFKDRNDKDRSTFALTEGEPSFQLFDKTGKPTADLLGGSQTGSAEKR
jgi:hypothetical protein